MDTLFKKFIPPGMNPVGAHIDDGNAEIVGVVTNMRQALDRPAMAEIDYTINELPPAQRMDYLRSMLLVWNATGDPRNAYASVREALHQVDPTVPFRTPETMGEIVLDQLRFERMESWLFGGFALPALVQAIVGLYGLLSHEVEQGRRDIGIRMALGATRALVLRVVAARAAAMVTAGLATGALLTVLADRAIAAVLPSSSAVPAEHLNAVGTQVFVFAATSAALFVISLLAALLPARRAATIEPMTALRME